MQVSSEAQAHIEQGNRLFWHEQFGEAAAAFAQAVQLAPDLAAGHLGMAQASLALGSYGIVQMACRKVQELTPTSPEGTLASALLFLLDHRYDRALMAAGQVIAATPDNAYAHALRGYCLRQLGREYEGALAEAKAARLGGNCDVHRLFPKATASPQGAMPTATTSAADTSTPQQPTWRPPSPWRRKIARIRFLTRDYHLVTTGLIIINVIVFLLAYRLPIFYIFGLQVNALVLEGEYWRLFTSMFLHLGWWHLGVNMLSLYFVGRWVEELFGPFRMLCIYFLSGISGGLLGLVLAPNAAQLGASGAIFGIFGAAGVFLWYKRYAVGPALSNWAFWLAINLIYTFGFSFISVSGHIGGLVAGLLLGLLLLPDFWVPVRTRLKRNQRAQAITYVARYLSLVLAADAVLLLLAFWLGQGR